MIIKNLKFTTPENNKYILTGEIDLLPNSGFTFTRLFEVNGKKVDNVILRKLVKHEDILNHIKNNQICQS